MKTTRKRSKPAPSDPVTAPSAAASPDIDHIKDLKPDGRNARRHNPRNIGMIETALNEVGAARSIVIDEGGNILAGNGTVEAAAQAGITRVKVVEADGNEIVAVRRHGAQGMSAKRQAVTPSTGTVAVNREDVVKLQTALHNAGRAMRDLEACLVAIVPQHAMRCEMLAEEFERTEKAVVNGELRFDACEARQVTEERT